MKPWSVKQHLAVGAVRVLVGHVLRPVHAGRGHRGRRQAQAAEVRAEVAGGEPAAQLDEADVLPAAVDRLARARGPGRELVGRRHLQRRVGDRLGGVRRRAPDVRPGLRPVVQAEHGDQDAVQLGRYAQAALAVAVGHRRLERARAGDQAELRPEHLRQRRDRPAEDHTARARVAADHLDPGERAGQHLRHQGLLGLVGAVPLPQVVTGDTGWHAVGGAG
jgi:hypothetical protein